MQKKVLCIITLVTMSLAGMEKESKIPLQLTHQSPEITRVHSQDYLKWLEKQADRQTIRWNGYSNANCSHEQLKAELQSIKAALKATNNIIKAKKNGITMPHFSIFFGDSNSFTSNKRLLKGFYHGQRIAYATIPIAAAHALQTNLFNRILIIDEQLDDSDPHTIKAYYKHGNGSLFYAHPNETTASLFNNKIITHDKINAASLWNFLNSDDQDIDLVFYSIDIDKNENTDQRKPNIFSLFQKLIPTVFIIPNAFFCTEEKTHYLTNYILKTASNISAILTPELEYFSSKFYYDNGRSEEVWHCVEDSSETETEDEHEIVQNKPSEFESSYSNSEESPETVSLSDNSDDDLDPFVFKITTHKNETQTYDGANYTLLAKNITITDDGIMEVILNPDYEIYSDYKRYNDSISTSSDNDNNGNSSNESSSANSVQENKLTHQSPEISCIHTQEYLEWLTNNHSEQELTAGLTWVAQALNTTHEIKSKVASNVLEQNKSTQPIYNICVIPESYYAASNNIPPQFGDLYAIIPIAAAHALQSGLFEKILIVEEHIKNQFSFKDRLFIDEFREYCWKENGSILYPHQKNKLFDLFGNKILIKNDYKVTDNCLGDELGYLSTVLKDTNIDLAFYNIDEDIQDYNKCVERVETITALLNKNIPTVFICSSQSIANDIENIIAQCKKHSDKKGIVCKNKFHW